MGENNFKEMILNDNYILWLSKFLEKTGEVDDIYFIFEHCLTEEDKRMISCLKCLFFELNKYAVENNFNLKNNFEYYLKYNDCIYNIHYNSEGYSLRKVDLNSNLPYIEYNEFKKQYIKNMEYNFKNLKSRVIDSLYNSDLEKINYELSNIVGPTLISGVGGSSVVSEFASKILSEKNKIITRNTEPRDFKYIDTSLYKNVLACSYSGNNYGVKLAFLNNLKHYLLASHENKKEDIINLTYNCKDKEKSFISLGATLIPITILLNYYFDNKEKVTIDNLDTYEFDFNTDCDIFEIFSGFETSTASKYLESTMVESGIGIPIVHDKYSYCHGRSTLSTQFNSTAIYLDTKKELDKLLLKELPKYYKDIVVLKSDNFILDEYKLLIKCMYLTKYIAESKKKDLSKVEYNQIVKKLYRYNGEL